MNWDNVERVPRGSLNAFQIKVGNSAAATVPEPGTIAAIFLTGMTGFGLRKKKK